MKEKKATPSTLNKFKPSSIVKKLTEALMAKTGIKSGPEFTAGP
jgi:hypothetical protein